MTKLNLNNRKFVLWLIVTFIAAIVGLAILFTLQNRELNEVVTAFNAEKDELLGEYQELAFQFDSLIPQNDSILLRLEIEQQKVVQLMEELETVKAANASKIREYKKELTTMRKVMKHFVFQIDSLSRVNEELRAENKIVAERYHQVTQTVGKLEKEKETLEKKVEIASQLEGYDFIVETLNDRDRKTRRLSKTVKIKICFTLSKNITAPVGEKPIYFRITAPNNDILIKNPEHTFQLQDKDINYSIIRVIEYESEAMEVCGYWNVEEFLFEGTYRVDVFADGFHIGETTFELD